MFPHNIADEKKGAKKYVNVQTGMGVNDERERNDIVAKRNIDTFCVMTRS